jgi:hypothetical protein
VEDTRKGCSQQREKIVEKTSKKSDEVEVGRQREAGRGY